MQHWNFAGMWTDRDIMYISYVGQLFLRMLKALILPLIIPSLIVAIGQLDITVFSTVGRRAVAYYMSTTVLAVLLGIILVVSIQPRYSSQESNDTERVIFVFTLKCLLTGKHYCQLQNYTLHVYYLFHCFSQCNMYLQLRTSNINKG